MTTHITDMTKRCNPLDMDIPGRKDDTVPINKDEGSGGAQRFA